MMFEYFTPPAFWNPIGNAFKSWFEDMANALWDAANGTVEGVVNFLTNPAESLQSAWEYNLYGSLWGLSEMIAMIVLIVVTLLALFFKKKIRDIGHAILIVIVLSIIAPNWIMLFEVVTGAGIELAQGVNSLNSVLPDDYNQKVKGDSIANLVGSSFIATVLMVVAAILYGVVLTYKPLAGLVKIVYLPSLASSAIGARAQKFLAIFTSIGIVTMVLGPAAAVLGIFLGRALGAGFSSGTTGAILGYQIVGVLIAIVLQVVCFTATYRGVSRVQGNISSNITSGDVDASIRAPQPVQTESHHNGANGLRKVEVPTDSSEGRSTDGSSTRENDVSMPTQKNSESTAPKTQPKPNDIPSYHGPERRGDPKRVDSPGPVYDQIKKRDANRKSDKPKGT